MNPDHFVITQKELTIQEVLNLLKSKKHLKLSETCEVAIQKCRDYLDRKMTESDDLIYGINTGFGSLCNTAISTEDLSQLQFNLVRSHACGMGERVPNEIVKLMLLLKILGLSKGHSGVQLATVERLVFFYNNDILPVIYQQGSLGASGDLAPLAHLSMPLFGEGEVFFNGEIHSAAEVMTKFHLEPITLQSKEGLALLNGTQFMSAYALWIVLKAQDLFEAANKIAALSLDAFDGRIDPFSDNIQKIRGQAGQIEVARIFRELLQGSEIIQQHKVNVQDPYSFRCIPQVHGASWDAIQYVAQIVENEINAVTDNPTIFPDTDEVISAGNFHGQPLAISMDFLAIALAELGSISERRTYKLISGTRDLPAFLVSKSGLNSGYMIPQYAQASIVSQNKQLCTPASVDTIDSSNGQEDHVSMGANAATKLYQVVENLAKILGIELMNASQAIEFRRPLNTSPQLEELLANYRQVVPFTHEDEYMHPRMVASKLFVENQMN
jgi:histidine ammonia-lyase